MKLSPRMLRRVIIAIFFLGLFILLGYGTKQLTTAPATCTDGIKNGDEEGVDCGLFACQNYCEPDLDSPKIASARLIEAAEGDYDFVAEIINPHQDFGASEIAYELTLFNGDDTILAKKEGTFYILPGQTKFLILPFITTENNITKHELIIKSARWQRLESLEGMNLIVRREQYNLAPGKTSSTLDAVIFNDSDYDFEKVDIDVVLRDQDNNIVAVNRSEIRTFIARTERHFSATWPFKIGGSVAKIDIIPSTNLFDNSNFIKAYGSEVEQFQQYKR